MATSELSVPFEARDLPGLVRVAVHSDIEPSTVGSPEGARGFPVCEATIDWDARGYRALLGWVQLVGTRPAATGSPREWVADPLEIYRGLNTPFGFHGLKPTLFDAPARRDRSRSLDWRAESYLCVAPSRPLQREVQPVAGFTWGFVLDDGEIAMTDPALLHLTAWVRHLDLLRSTYPGWTFLDPTG